MTGEEMADKHAKEYVKHWIVGEDDNALMQEAYKDGFLDGLKVGRPQWHEVTDWKDNSQFPNDELKTYLVRLYQDHYVICELDITKGCRQFYLPDNLEEIDPKDVIVNAYSEDNVITKISN